MARPRLAARRVVGRPHGGGEPDAAPLIEHRVVHVVLTGPQSFTAPVGRGLSRRPRARLGGGIARSEEHTSELQSRSDLVCRLLLEKKKKCRARYYRVS